MQIEFFHDVLCAWCYAVSPRVRRLAKEYPVEVVHRCFALAPTPEAIVEIFGSKEEGKREILDHWRMANLNDDEHRINADLMEKRDFDYPHSIPGLLACKAAEIVGGQNVHWDVFDRIQKAHLTECRNIADFEVLISCVKDVGLDVEAWHKAYIDRKTFDMMLSDFERAYGYGVTGVPTLVANSRYGLVGAQKYETIKKWLEKIIQRELPSR
ncbi:MAG: DsbA family protein [Thaumarchaeota archaeon]|nr:DsbA family protein [Nitrososphaerota archaeon]